MPFFEPNKPLKVAAPDAKVVVEGTAPNNKPLPAGRYKFELVVVDKDGVASDPFVAEVRVVDKPEANFRVVRTPLANQPFELDASGSRDPDGEIETYIWRLLP